MSKQAKMTIAPIERIIRRYQEELATAQRRLAAAIEIRENIQKSNSKELK